MTGLTDRLAAVRQRIEAAGGSPERVKLIAVTKGFGPDVVREALAVGLDDLGESYAQELAAKVATVEPAPERGSSLPLSGAGSVRAGPRWHFISRIQTNKVRLIAPHVTLWHGVDRESAGREIAKRSPGAAVLVQVNATGEASKAGCTPDDLPRLLDELRATGLDVRGLMTIAPLGQPDVARTAFAKVREMADFHGLDEVSMGMSDDLDVAVSEGATMVRVGAALFGPRPGAAGVGH